MRSSSSIILDNRLIIPSFCSPGILRQRQWTRSKEGCKEETSRVSAAYLLMSQRIHARNLCVFSCLHAHSFTHFGRAFILPYCSNFHKYFIPLSSSEDFINDSDSDDDDETQSSQDSDNSEKSTADDSDDDAYKPSSRQKAKARAKTRSVCLWLTKCNIFLQ